MATPMNRQLMALQTLRLEHHFQRRFHHGFGHTDGMAIWKVHLHSDDACLVDAPG